MQDSVQEIIVLLVEGKRNSDSMAEGLRKLYTVEVVHSGKDALQWLKTNQPAIVVFDSCAMRSSGVRASRRLQADLHNVPMVHCRAENTPLPHNAGADVYLQRPFTPRKLINRISALLPANIETEEIVRCGCLTLYRTKRSVEVDGRNEKTLTPKLFHLLEEFIRHPNQIVSRKQLMQNVWRTDYVGDTRTLDVHIRWIRECIEENPNSPQLLKTVRGKGYIFQMPKECPTPSL